MQLRTAVRGFTAAAAAGVLALLGAPPTAAAPGPAAPAAADEAAPPVRQAPEVYEAEDGELQGVTVASTAPGFSGTGYVEGFDEADDQVTVTIPDSPGGLYELTVHYRGPYGRKNAVLRLNGEGMGEVTLPETTEFSTAPAGKVLLEPGDNTISVVNGWGWYEIDALALAPVPPRPPHQVTGEPVNPHATPEARGLLRYLTDGYGRRILSGQQDMSGIAWLEENIGRTPAVAGLDMMDYSPSRVERGTSSQEVENALAWDERGGITTFVWHWNAPAGLIDEPGREWWRGFYTDATTFDLAAALADPASEEYALLLRDIDAIAAELTRLRDAGVPVLWRPLHEAEGGWFWWGAKGPEPAKELWRLMHQRMTEVHELHNLLWVWNSVDPAWYPGDDVVDIVSADSYPPAGDHGPVSGTYDRLVELGQDAKLVALTEVGSIPDPDLLEAYRADWAWFVTWSGDFLTDGVSNPRAHLEHVYHHPRVVTLDELGDFKEHGGCTATHRVVTKWGTGHHVEVTVRNTGTAPLSGWEVSWPAPAGETVRHVWNARLTTAGDRVRATAQDWNGDLPPGGGTTFGYLGGGTLPDSLAPAPSCAAAGG
ncbi:glycosyl hydrolase [Streptomyces marincola]|uniref:glycosyl hydrolase n=1 Tax=Streptomyces marincola TaxID=2878388 RepID=UPI001CF2A6BF|nr:glycosyl hydrolase [Streptomyces marincola]UCM91390.1 cellulose binding domain-containing protein [Streptomyces marincola]